MKTRDSYEDFAILYRTNAQSRILEESLRKRNIPYRIYGGLSFYQRKEVKDAIAYFRLAVNPDDDEALKRIINYPARGIGDTTLNKVMRAAIDNNVSMWTIITGIDTYSLGLNKGTAGKLNNFASMIQRFIDANAAGLDAYQLSKKIIDETHLLSCLYTDNTPESISKQQNLQELINGTSQFVTDRQETDEESSVGISDFLGEVSLATDQDEADTSEERVTLMTVHAAKGLEFGNIIVVGVEDDLFPSSMSKSSLSEIEEERRLLYVAITRAKRHCILTYAGQRYRNGQTMATQPSPFLRDIDSKYLSLSLGSSSADFGSSSVSGYRESFHTPIMTVGTRRPVFSAHATPGNSTSQPSVRPSAPSGSNGTHTASELATGMTIEHSRFGRGIIKSIDTSQVDHKITVQFSNVDTKVLLLKFAKFTIVNP